MKILLINPLLTPRRPPSVYNIGLGYIAASLLQEGHEVSLLDIEGYRYSPARVSDMIDAISCEAIAIGTLITGYKYLKWLVKQIRKSKPDIPIWVGNSIASSIPEILLHDIPVDIAVLGEGEQTIKELAKSAEEGGDLATIDGICFKSDGKIIYTPPRQLIEDLDSIPFPAWQLFPQKIYMNSDYSYLSLSKPMAHINTVRGCPYHCTYCYHPFQNSKIRFHSAARVVEEIKRLQHEYKVKSICFADDLFIIDKKRIYQICDLIDQEKLKIQWTTSARVNLVDKELLIRMKQSGCVSLAFGIESASQKILDNIKKQATVEQAKLAVTLCKQVGITPICSFMIGNLGENRETAFASVDFIQQHLETALVFFITTPYPKTELYESMKQRGKIGDEIALFESYGEQADSLLVNCTDMDDDQLLALKREAEHAVWEHFVKKHPGKHLANLWKTLWLSIRQEGFIKASARVIRFFLSSQTIKLLRRRSQ